jgi:voltage-gated potassium channel
MSVITVTTVGYGEVIPTENAPALRSYTLALILVGVGVMLYAVAVVTAFIVEGDLNQYFWKRRMQRHIDALTEHFIVCGAGETGQRVIEELSQTNREFVVIDPDPPAVAEFRSKYDQPILEGVSDDVELLKTAGVERASGAVVALPNDRDNLVTTLSIRMLNPSIRIVTKEIDPGMAERL